MPVSFCVLQRFLRTNGNVFENKREREAEPSAPGKQAGRAPGEDQPFFGKGSFALVLCSC